MDEFLYNNIHILPLSQKKLINDWIKVSIMMQNDDLIHLIADQCDIETHLTLRKTCKRFYHQLIKPLTLDEAFDRHLMDIETGLMQLVKLMKQKYRVNSAEMFVDSWDEINVDFDLENDLMCEYVTIHLLDGSIFYDFSEVGSIFDVAPIVENSKIVRVLCNKKLITFDPDFYPLHPKVKCLRELFKNCPPQFDFDSFVIHLNQKIQSSK